MFEGKASILHFDTIRKSYDVVCKSKRVTIHIICVSGERLMYHWCLMNSKLYILFVFFVFEHKRTPSGKKRMTGVQAVTASEVQSIGCRWWLGHFVLRTTGDPIEAHTSKW